MWRKVATRRRRAVSSILATLVVMFTCGRARTSLRRRFSRFVSRLPFFAGSVARISSVGASATRNRPFFGRAKPKFPGMTFASRRLPFAALLPWPPSLVCFPRRRSVSRFRVFVPSFVVTVCRITVRYRLVVRFLFRTAVRIRFFEKIGIGQKLSHHRRGLSMDANENPSFGSLPRSCMRFGIAAFTFVSICQNINYPQQ